MSESDELIRGVGLNIQEKAALIWSVADTLRGPYKPHEYGLVILPMTVIKRFHDCLLPTHDKVLAAAEKYKNFAVKDGFLREASGYPFYNTSKFTFETLKADPENIGENFKDYLNGFSDNVQDILARMNFSDQVERLSDPDAPMLYQVVSDFCSPKADMSPDKIKAVDMGYIFENLIQRFSESYDEDAGAHFTSRDIVYLMTDLLIAADPSVFGGSHITKTVYDQTMGTSQMLGCTEERLRQLDADARVTCFGQEFNPFTYGIARLRGSGGGFRPKDILSAPLAATLAAVLLFALRVPVPTPVRSILSSVSAATVPMSMLLVGSSLGSVNLGKALRDRSMILLAAERFVLAPVIVFFLMKLICSDDILSGAMVITAASPSAILVTALSLQTGRSGEYSSEGITVTTLLSMITIPLTVYLLL